MYSRPLNAIWSVAGRIEYARHGADFLETQIVALESSLIERAIRRATAASDITQ